MYMFFLLRHYLHIVCSTSAFHLRQRRMRPLCRSQHGALLLSEKTLDSLFEFGAEAQLLRALQCLRSQAFAYFTSPLRCEHLNPRRHPLLELGQEYAQLRKLASLFYPAIRVRRQE